MRVVFLVLAILAQQTRAAPSCEDLGFSNLVLCSDCKQLANFVSDQDLVKECLQCCAEDVKQHQVTFTSALLEVCPHSLRAFPHIEEFINKKLETYTPALKIRYRPGYPPRLRLYSSGTSGEEQVVKIDQWHTQHVEEYLNERLQLQQGDKIAES